MDKKVDMKVERVGKVMGVVSNLEMTQTNPAGQRKRTYIQRAMIVKKEIARGIQPTISRFFSDQKLEKKVQGGHVGAGGSGVVGSVAQCSRKRSLSDYVDVHESPSKKLRNVTSKARTAKPNGKNKF